MEIVKIAECRQGRLFPPTVDVFPNKVIIQKYQINNFEYNNHFLEGSK